VHLLNTQNYSFLATFNFQIPKNLTAQQGFKESVDLNVDVNWYQEILNMRREKYIQMVISEI
jgi:hypothetical protein